MWRPKVILTYKGRHFPQEALKPWEMEVQKPSTFLRYQYELNPERHRQARRGPRTLGDHCPNFEGVQTGGSQLCRVLANDLGLDIEK